MSDIRIGFQAIGIAFKIWWDDWSNQILVGLAAILLSLTVVLAPAVVFGIFQEALDLTHGVRTGILGFWQGFKLYLRLSLGWGILNVIATAGVLFSAWFYMNTKFSFSILLLVFVVLIGLVWFVWQFLSTACLFLQENKSLKLAWKNGSAILLTRPFLSLISGVLAAGLLFLSARYFIPLFLGVPAFIAILALVTVQKTIEANQ